MRKHWLALYTKPRNEKKVVTRLSRMGIECYCPLRKTIRQWSDRKKIVSEPLFTSYVFVKVDEPTRWQVLGDPGVVQFVFWLGKPAIIRDQEIEAIEQFLNDHPTALAMALPVKVGDRVKVVTGPLKGQIGVVKDEQRNRIVLQLEQMRFTLIAEIAKARVAIA